MVGTEENAIWVPKLLLILKKWTRPRRSRRWVSRFGEDAEVVDLRTGSPAGPKGARVGGPGSRGLGGPTGQGLGWRVRCRLQEVDCSRESPVGTGPSPKRL